MERFKGLPFVGQVIVTAILMAIIAFVGWKYFPGIGGRLEAIQAQQKTLDDLLAEVQKGVNLERKLPELEREITNLESQLEELKTIIPPVRRDSELVAKLQSLAVRSRLSIEQILPQRLRKKDFYDEYPIAINVLANYHDLAKFFDRMAHLPRIFNVNGVSLKQARTSVTPGSSAPYSIDASFTAVTFIYRDEPPPPPEPKKAPAAKADAKESME